MPCRGHIQWLAWWDEYKATLSCERCGISHPAVLDFHHRDPSTKSFSISDIMRNHRRSREVILAEISKCRVLCSNCHRILHWEERNH